jgi:protein-L-isoaspartate O-methyltransferase
VAGYQTACTSRVALLHCTALHCTALHCTAAAAAYIYIYIYTAYRYRKLQVFVAKKNLGYPNFRPFDHIL